MDIISVGATARQCREAAKAPLRAWHQDDSAPSIHAHNQTTVTMPPTSLTSLQRIRARMGRLLSRCHQKVGGRQMFFKSVMSKMASASASRPAQGKQKLSQTKIMKLHVEYWDALPAEQRQKFEHQARAHQGKRMRQTQDELEELEAPLRWTPGGARAELWLCFLVIPRLGGPSLCHNLATSSLGQYCRVHDKSSVHHPQE